MRALFSKLSKPVWPAHPKIARWAGYGILVVAAANAGRLVSIPSEIREREQSRAAIARQLAAFVSLEKEKVDKINDLARDYIHTKQLKPGDPLPPKAVLTPEAGSLMDTGDASQLMTKFTAKDGRWQAMATSLISVENKVPQKGEKYAYLAAEVPIDVFGFRYEIHPQDQFGGRRMLEAGRAAALKLKDKGR
jgi:hypothetical protein